MRLFFFFLCACMTVITACNEKEKTDNILHEPVQTVQDVYGRTVTLPKKIESIVCVGNGSLRLVTYLNALDLVVGVEETDLNYEKNPQRDYAFVNHSILKSLPIIGKGGGSAYTAYPEQIIALKPDVILSSYSKEALAQLEKDTGIPVLAVRYESINFIDKSFIRSIELLGEVLSKKTRAEEIVTFIKKAKNDLYERTVQFPSKKKPSVYAGAVTFNGAHGFSGTSANFGPLMAVYAKNVADNAEHSGFYEADLEQILLWDPDIIFVDPSNKAILKKEYEDKTSYFSSIKAVQNGEVYTLPSYNNYSTNVSYALINAYFAGIVLYPKQFDDILFDKKANEILEFFLGKQYFDTMQKSGLYFGKFSFKR